MNPLIIYPNEKKFQAEVSGFARLYGWQAFHQLDSRGSEEGLADCIAWRDPTRYQTCLIVAELKLDGNKPTEAQLLFLAACEAMAIPNYVWYPKDWPIIQRVFTSEGATPCLAKSKQEVTPEQLKKMFRLNKPGSIRLK